MEIDRQGPGLARARTAQIVTTSLLVQDMLMPVTGIFFNRGWTIIRFTRKMLATCDTPVMLVRHPSSVPRRSFVFYVVDFDHDGTAKGVVGADI